MLVQIFERHGLEAKLAFLKVMIASFLEMSRNLRQSAFSFATFFGEIASDFK